MGCLGYSMITLKKSNEIHEERFKMVNQNFPNQYMGEEDLPGEEWRPVIYQGIEIPKYFVSQFGGVKGPRSKRLKWTVRARGGKYPHVSLNFPSEDFIGDFTRASRSRATAVHILVANSFLPLTNDTVPDQLKGYNFTEDTLSYLRELLFVDHIDNNPANPDLTNLRYCSSKENNWRQKQAKSENESST